ncbi:MAG: hypothetical protein K0S09_1500 [Sphingobacteriaceae bacterium]|jgi:hypothetical protein|nr:hypothetical protein [Sphingobacteriaceae bacterium]
MTQVQWEGFLKELAVIEVKYWRNLKKTQLRDHYELFEDEQQMLRFKFKDDCDLPQEIRDECFALFKKYQLEQSYHSKKQA